MGAIIRGRRNYSRRRVWTPTLAAAAAALPPKGEYFASWDGPAALIAGLEFPMHHYLQPLLAPDSVALVGASERPGSLGRIVYENLLGGGFTGELFAVNPHHRKILARAARPTLAAIGRP